MASRFVPRVLKQTRGYATQATIRPPIQVEGLAGKYATAAYVSALTKSEKDLTKVESDLKFFNGILKGESANSQSLRVFLQNPTVAATTRTSTVDEILRLQKGGADQFTINLFNTLSQNGRLNLTEKVIDGFLELMNAHRGEVVVTITSAKPLDKSLTSRLESALKQSQYATTNGAKSVKFDYVVKSSIEGGLMVEFGGRSVDLTVANRVNKLNALLRESI